MKTEHPLTLLLLAIMLFGCASTAPPTIFVPSEKQDVRYFYRDGIPIITTATDSILFAFVLDFSVRLGREDYARLWVLVKNNPTNEFLVDPLNSFKLIPVYQRRVIDSLSPVPRPQILARIDNEQATALMLQTIGATLKALSVEPTTLTDSRGNQVQINDRREKVDEINRQASADLANTSTVYKAFKSSVNAGVLRCNTLFPGEGVNGYVYFQLPRPMPYYEGVFDFERYDLILRMITPIRSRSIDLFRTTGD